MVELRKKPKSSSLAQEKEEPAEEKEKLEILNAPSKLKPTPTRDSNGTKTSTDTEVDPNEPLYNRFTKLKHIEKPPMAPKTILSTKVEDEVDDKEKKGSVEKIETKTSPEKTSKPTKGLKDASKRSFSERAQEVLKNKQAAAAAAALSSAASSRPVSNVTNSSGTSEPVVPVVVESRPSSHNSPKSSSSSLPKSPKYLDSTPPKSPPKSPPKEVDELPLHIRKTESTLFFDEYE